ncbi:MAG: 50S ribosomal protein L16 [Gammaproteobacteria bacterium]|nr:50S ribosomal protein L16 [Gammaproteobacteria bacterium]
MEGLGVPPPKAFVPDAWQEEAIAKLREGDVVVSVPTGSGKTYVAVEAARRAIQRHVKRQGRLWIRIFPDLPVSSKPAEVRMGSGKGAPEYWAARVKPGRILFELDGVPGPLAAEAFSRAAMKLPIKTKVVARLGDTSHLGAK